MLDLLLDNNFLSSIIAFAIILIPAIIIHELGHFVAAKMVGISVLEFGVGFPPRMARLFMWGETEFTINWLPIGGFVRPLGEDMIGPVAEESYPDDDYDGDKPKNVTYISEREELMSRGVPEDKLQSVNDTKPWPRIWFMVAGAVFNVVSAVIFFVIAALIGIPIEMGARVVIAEYPESSVFNQPQVYAGDAIELINGEYFADPATFFDDLSAYNGETVELTLRHPHNFENEELAGQRYVISIVPDVDPQSLLPSVFISGVVEESPAAEAGILPGDHIIAVNDVPVAFENPVLDLVTAAEEFAGSPVELTVLRNGAEIELTLIPRENPPPGEGRIGVAIAANWKTQDDIHFHNELNAQYEMVPQPFGDAVAYGVNRTGMVLKLIIDLPGQLISGAISPEQARPVSIVGISQIGGRFLQESIRTGSPSMVLDFIALISIFLGVTNLLPFPPLDGGRILFVLIEIIRGKPVPPQIENMVYRIGIAILLILGVIIIIFDIFNPINLG